MPAPTEPPPSEDFRRFLLQHRFGMDEMVTKLTILRDEFTHLHDYNPIESVTSRLKSPESLLEKIQRKGLVLADNPTFDQIRERVTDIAGVRVVCSFSSDVHRVFDLLTGQVDVEIVEVRDYITTPKPNGYRSLHALVQVPVFLSGGAVPVMVEVQLRTIAMDFWASLEHKIYYKYRRDVPATLLLGLREAAETAYQLDCTMERLHDEVRHLDAPAAGASGAAGAGASGAGAAGSGSGGGAAEPERVSQVDTDAALLEALMGLGRGPVREV